MKTEMIKGEKVIVTDKNDLKKGAIILDNDYRNLTLEKLKILADRKSKIVVKK